MTASASPSIKRGGAQAAEDHASGLAEGASGVLRQRRSIEQDGEAVGLAGARRDGKGFDQRAWPGACEKADCSVDGLPVCGAELGGVADGEAVVEIFIDTGVDKGAVAAGDRCDGGAGGDLAGIALGDRPDKAGDGRCDTGRDITRLGRLLFFQKRLHRLDAGAETKALVITVRPRGIPILTGERIAFCSGDCKVTGIVERAVGLAVARVDGGNRLIGGNAGTDGKWRHLDSPLDRGANGGQTGVDKGAAARPDELFADHDVKGNDYGENAEGPQEIFHALSPYAQRVRVRSFSH